jgi:hypothetical protein
MKPGFSRKRIIDSHMLSSSDGDDRVFEAYGYRFGNYELPLKPHGVLADKLWGHLGIRMGMLSPTIISFQVMSSTLNAARWRFGRMNDGTN